MSKITRKYGINESYAHFIEPNLDKIAHWRQMGENNETICKWLGIEENVLIKCAKRFVELEMVLRKSKEDLVMSLEARALQKALSGNTDLSKYFLEVLKPEKYGKDANKASDDRVIIVDDFDTIPSKHKEEIQKLLKEGN